MSRPKVSAIRNLFAGMQRNDPASYNGLMQMLDYLEKQEAALFPIIAEFNAPVVSVPGNPSSFAYDILPYGVLLRWTFPTGIFSTVEVRKGTIWDTADFVARTASLNILVEPLLIGTHTYLLKSLSSAGTYSETALSVEVTITGPGVVSLTSNVIDNNVLLYWSQPATQFTIAYYVITQDGIELGRVSATFFPITMVESGTYTFGVYAVDIAGNEGAVGTIEADVAQPPDYVLQDSFQSNLDQTRVNCFRFV